MIRELTFKKDFSKTIDRFEAWWRGELIDRPPIVAWTRPARTANLPAKTHPTQRDRGMDADPALTVMDALGPRGLFRLIEKPFDSVASAEAFEAAVARKNATKSVHQPKVKQ